MTPRSYSAIRLSLLAFVVTLAMPAIAGDQTVGQARKAFTLGVLKARVGDTVTFRNDDEFAHNVFSLSDVQSFDLGSYKKGEVRSVKLTAPGVIEVECAIHPEMKMQIEVAK
jgi:plastocyanin